MAVVSVCKAELPSVAGATEMGISGCVVGGGSDGDGSGYGGRGGRAGGSVPRHRGI